MKHDSNDSLFQIRIEKYSDLMSSSFPSFQPQSLWRTCIRKETEPLKSHFSYEENEEKMSPKSSHKLLKYLEIRIYCLYLCTIYLPFPCIHCIALYRNLFDKIKYALHFDKESTSFSMIIMKHIYIMCTILYQIVDIYICMLFVV